MKHQLKAFFANVSKETVKEELVKHGPEIIQGATVLMLAYICLRINAKPVNVIVNVQGGVPYVIK